tara:strand:+ start:350 stop:550 length:201 start_codon:yes stop_codon:yes gene_type:complete
MAAAGRPKKGPPTNDESLEAGIKEVIGLKPGERAKLFDRSFITRFNKEHAPYGDIKLMALIAKHAK